MIRKRKFTIVILLCLSVCTVNQAGAQNPTPSEYAVKAAFLYNFTKFVQWPEDVLKKQDSLGICILGTNPFGNSLESIIDGKTVDSKPIKISYASEVSEISDCQVLFVTSGGKKQRKAALAAVTDLPVLTVSDLPEFAASGGIIGFYLDNNRVGFEVNNRVAKGSGLSFSSRLLKIARVIEKKITGR